MFWFGVAPLIFCIMHLHFLFYADIFKRNLRLAKQRCSLKKAEEILIVIRDFVTTIFGSWFWNVFLELEPRVPIFSTVFFLFPIFVSRSARKVRFLSKDWWFICLTPHLLVEIHCFFFFNNRSLPRIPTLDLGLTIFIYVVFVWSFCDFANSEKFGES